MAITKINSLAIPAGTVEPADIGYPLTNFSSTGIDDNAASTALTIDLAGNVELNGGNILLNEGATGEASIGIKNGSSTGNQQASIVFYGEDNYYPGQVHIVSRSDNTGPTAGDISFWDYTGSTWHQNVTIKKDGKVGIGLHNPSTVLHLREAGTGSGEGDLIIATTSDGGNAGLRFRTGTSDRFSITTIGSAGSESLRIRDVNNNTERMRIDSSGNVGIGTTSPGCKLQVTGGPTRADEYQWNDGGRYVRDFSGIASYWSQNEYIELCTITPGGNSQNYFVEGCIKAQSSHNLDIVRFSVAVRSNTLPTLVYLASYDRERYGNDYGMKPYIWHDTTNGVIKVVVKNTSTAGVHNAEYELNITARSTSQARDNVSYSGAERTAVTSGFTEQDTFIFRKNSYVNDTYYFERHEQRPFIRGTPYNTSSANTALADAMQVAESRHLSFSNSRVTVPIAGVYLISFNSISYGSNTSGDRADIYITVNGATVAASLQVGHGSSDYRGKSASIMINLSANDYIQFQNTEWYRSGSGVTSYDNWQTASVVYLG